MELSGRWVFSGRPIVVTVEDGVVAAVQDEPRPPDDRWLAPGFWDLQVNGYHGYDYSGPDLSGPHISAITDLLADAGTTHHVATIITNSAERIAANLRVIHNARQQSARLASAIAGIHLEGPYISAEDGPRGAHDRRYVRDPDYGEFCAWQEACGGLVRMLTLAPERKGAIEFIERLTADGVIVALGHTGAEPERIRDAIAAGARLSTHLGNGSHATLPRLSNYLWEQLAADELWAGVIADGFHLSPAVARVFSRAKELSRLILVSDVAPCGGYPSGRYRWGDIEVEVYPDGHLGLAGSEFLAGAGHLLDRCVAWYVQHTDADLAQAVQLVTVNPARLLGIEGRDTNEPRTGTPADLVRFGWQPGAESLSIEATVNGRAARN